MTLRRALAWPAFRQTALQELLCLGEALLTGQLQT
jgi:hypothetical protein